VPDFLLVSAVLVLVTVALGLVSILRGPGNAKRMMAAQLLGSGGVAALLLFGTASGTDGAVDVALTLAVLSAFASIAFVKKGTTRELASVSDDESDDAAQDRLVDVVDVRRRQARR
jgi:multicomponent Na+:H+ antiporter subunit F